MSECERDIIQSDRETVKEGERKGRERERKRTIKRERN